MAAEIYHYRDHQRAVDRWSNMERVKSVCVACKGEGVVCENHPDKPWGEFVSHPEACSCGAGAPCQTCDSKGFPFFDLKPAIPDTAPSEYCAPESDSA